MSQIREPVSPMSVALKKWVDEIEVREALRGNLKRPDARAQLARRWKISFWTLTNLRRGRLKNLSGEVRDKIWAGIIREYEQEISRITHELQIARQCGMAPCGDEMLALETAVAKANEILARGPLSLPCRSD